MSFNISLKKKNMRSVSHNVLMQDVPQLKRQSLDTQAFPNLHNLSMPDNRFCLI